MAQTVTDVVKALATQEKAAIDRLVEWLRIPSVSTDPAHKKDCIRAAEWAAARLGEAGIDATLEQTGSASNPGHPIVWAHHAGPAGYAGPHVLFYGHYDVQPPDPLELWKSPPFDPVIVPADPGPKGEVPGERIVARGAVDDKGQVASFLEALRAWKTVTGSIPIKLTILLEGEEESGSVNLDRFLEQHADHLRTCNIVVISDTGMLSRTQPAITYGVRGLAYTEVVLHAADQDLHSGLWGGRCPNPISELTKVLSQLWDADRKITIPGFYDDVQVPTAEERKAWAALPFDQLGALKKIGMGPAADVGEKGWTSLEREWARPTAEINGIYGGYMGKGAKTVIPAQAGAKVSFRLVANQDPEKVARQFKQWLEARTPAGCRWEYHVHSGGFPGNVASSSPYLQAASRALRSAAGTEPKLIKSGGSIPVVGSLKSLLGLDTVLVGFGLDDDRVHSPNEKFELECFRLGMRTHAYLLEEMGRVRG